ncbi:unnamed protein product [Calypogeia fissa]
MENDDAEWVPGDGEPTALADRDRILLPPSTELQGRYSNWRNRGDFMHIPDLGGRTLQEVGEEAGRIKLGEYFNSLVEFQRFGAKVR